jgi:hypothetical protein
VFFGFIDGHLHGFAGSYLSHGPVRFYDGGYRRFEDDLHAGFRIHVPADNGIVIADHPLYAVRFDSIKIRAQNNIGDSPGFIFRKPMVLIDIFTVFPDFRHIQFTVSHDNLLAGLSAASAYAGCGFSVFYYSIDSRLEQGGAGMRTEKTAVSAGRNGAFRGAERVRQKTGKAAL